MASASDAWARQSWDREMRGDLYPGPPSPVVRLPDPDDFAPDTLEYVMARRLHELDRAHPKREEGRRIVEKLALFYDAGAEWLLDVGGPKAMERSDDWDDEVDWKEARDW